MRPNNSKGFTLVEVMVSLVVLLLVFLGLMQGALLAIDTNVQTMLRQDAVDFGMAQMQAARDAGYASLSGSPAVTVTQTKTYRNNISVTFTSVRTVTTLDANNLQVSVSVTWPWRGQTYSFATATILSNL